MATMSANQSWDTLFGRSALGSDASVKPHGMGQSASADPLGSMLSIPVLVAVGIVVWLAIRAYE